MNKCISTVQPIVDLRSILSNVRDQGKRPLCLVFASSDVNSTANNITDQLSVEYLAYYSYLAEGTVDYSSGLSPGSVISVLSSKGQPLEVDFSYSPDQDKPAIPLEEFEKKYFSECEEHTPSITDLKSDLDNGQPVVLGVGITNSFFTIEPPFILEDDDGVLGLHAILVVGYGQDEEGVEYYLIRNSWGKNWADNGYCWVTSGFIVNKSKVLIRVVD